MRVSWNKYVYTNVVYPKVAEISGSQYVRVDLRKSQESNQASESFRSGLVVKLVKKTDKN